MPFISNLENSLPFCVCHVLGITIFPNARAHLGFHKHKNFMNNLRTGGKRLANQIALTEWEKFQIKLEVWNKIQTLLSSSRTSPKGLLTSMTLLLNLQVWKFYANF